MTGGALAATTSGIAQTDILAAIASVALLASLVATELLSLREGWAFPFGYNKKATAANKKATAAVLGINVTLMIIFFVGVAFSVSQMVVASQ
jgi:hypothetical protein